MQFLLALLVIFSLSLLSLINHLNFWGYQPTETESFLVSLNNPLAVDSHAGRSLNVWDLQVFDGKVYIAGGSTVDNSGPINVWAYYPAGHRFEKEYTVREEAIEHFRVFDDRLYIPASDPVEGDAYKFYRRASNEPWQLFQDPSIELAHVRDLIRLDTGEVLVIGNNRYTKQLSKPATAITHDGGQTFQETGIENPPDSEYNWFFSVFSYQGQIYAPTSLLKDSLDEAGAIATFDRNTGKFELDPDLRNSEFIPQANFENPRGKWGRHVIYRLWHPVEFKEALVYPVRSYSYYDRNYKQAYMNSIGFYVKPAPGVSPTAVSFPDGKSVGEDILTIDDELYVLANAKLGRNKFVIYVYKTDEPTAPNSWEEVLHVRSCNRARSFEYLDNTFYFGLGQNYGESIGRAGEILSLSAVLQSD